MSAVPSKTPVADAVRYATLRLGNSNLWMCALDLTGPLYLAHVVNSMTAAGCSALNDDRVMCDMTEFTLLRPSDPKHRRRVRDTHVLRHAGAPVDPLEARWS